MSSVSASYPNRAASAGPFLLMVIFLAAIGAVGLAISHGVERHGEAALTVRNCLNRGGEIQRWQNENTGRIARVCQIGPETFGIQIIEEIEGRWEEITSFIKNKFRCVSKVERYLQNTGYEIIN